MGKMEDSEFLNGNVFGNDSILRNRFRNFFYLYI